MKRYQGKTAIVTGAGMGIGKVIARRLADEGAGVVLTDVRAEDAADVVEGIGKTGGRALFVPGSVTDEAAIAETVARAKRAYGRIDMLVNNAAFTIKANLAECPPDFWDKEIDVTLKGAYLFCRAVLPAMVEQGGGNIVNIGSVNGLTYVGNPAYSAAKAGLLSLTKSLAVEYGSHGIRANMVSPGTIRTDNPTWTARQQKDPKIFEKLSRWYPVGRVGKPEDIAAAVAYLGSDEAGFVSGANLVVDGGLTAGLGLMVRELTLERENG